MAKAARRGHSLAVLGVAPLLLALGLAVWFVSDRLVIIGPFDRAQIGWAVVVPLLAMAPGVAALAGPRAASPELARLVVAGMSIGTGVLVVIGLAATITVLDCRPVSSPLEVVPRTLPTAFVMGIGFAISAAAAWGPALRGRTLVALLVGAMVWIVAAALGLVVFLLSFPTLSCAAPQG
jgi:hypothetical protein